MKTQQIKARNIEQRKLSFLFLLQLWIIASAILAEITDRVLICWKVTSVTAVQILQDKIVNLVSAGRITAVLQYKNANPLVDINMTGLHWIIIRKMRKEMSNVHGSSVLAVKYLGIAPLHAGLYINKLSPFALTFTHKDY